MIDYLNSYSAHLIYALLFFLLFLCGIGFPMAEELVLLAGGVLVASGVLHPVLMLFSTFLGVITGDVLLFWLGRGLATRLTTSIYFTRWLSPRKLLKGRTFFAQHGNTTVFLARFIPGLRAPTFLLAGTMQMGLWRFVAMDILAAFIFVPIICGGGYLFADHIDAVAAWFRSFERVCLTLLAITGLTWLLRRYRGKRTNRLPTPHADAVDCP
jgi:membrane protein DedA with SNARE-associated domain